MSLTCEQLEMHLTAFVFDELDDAAASEQVRVHLEACPLCRAKLQQLRSTIGTLHAAVAEMPSPVLSEDRRAALREAVKADAATPADAAPAAYKFANWKRPLALAASVALIGTAGVGIYQSMSGQAPNTPLSTVAMSERWGEAPGRATNAIGSLTDEKDAVLEKKSAEEVAKYDNLHRQSELASRFEMADKYGDGIADTPTIAAESVTSVGGSFGADRKQAVGDDMLALQSRGLAEGRGGEARRDVSQRYFAAKPGEKADNAKREIALGEVMTPTSDVDGESFEYRAKAGEATSRGRQVAANDSPFDPAAETPAPAARPMSKAAAAPPPVPAPVVTAPAPSQPMLPAKPAAPRPEFSGDAGGLGGGNANVAGKLADARQAAENKPTAQTASGLTLGTVAQAGSRSETTPDHATQQKAPLSEKQMPGVDATEQAKPLNQTAREGLEAARMQKGADDTVALAEDYADMSKLRRAQIDARRDEAMKKAKDQLPAAPADASAPREEAAARALRSGERGEALKDIEAEQQMQQLDNTVALRDAEKEAVNGRRLNRMDKQTEEAKKLDDSRMAQQAEVPYSEMLQFPADWPAGTSDLEKTKERLAETELRIEQLKVESAISGRISVISDGKDSAVDVSGTAAKLGLAERNYRSSGTVRLQPILPRVLYQSEQNSLMPMFDAYVGSQVAMMESSRIVKKAMESETWKKAVGDAKIDEKTFVSNLKVTHPDNSELMIVQYEASDKKIAEAAVKAVLDSYMESFGDKDVLSVNRRLEQLEQHRSQLHKELSTLQRQQQAQQQLEPTEDVTLPPASSFRPMPVNPFVMTQQDKFSTFAIDVDTASYALCRKYIRSGFLPPAGAVRMEEFINSFDYNYPAQADRTFAVHVDGARAPFGENLSLVKIGVKAKTLGRDGRKPAHLVFVVDASGSMDKADRLPLVKQSLKLLAAQLDDADHVSIVTYGTAANLIAEYSAGGNDEAGDKQIRQAVDAIATGGSTNMIDGLKLGYDIARRHFRAGYINHIVLCSDGVANVGETEAAAMLDQVAGARKQGITLTSVGFGIGAYNDAMMEQLANRGDGQYVFVDSAAEAKRVFVDRLASTLQTVARDAKIQVEFDPARVRRYRLIGYENRDIADQDFRNDAVDAGEVGSGQSATALYEVELIGDDKADLGAVSVRYRDVDTEAVEEISYRLLSGEIDHAAAPKSQPRLYLAAAAAEFAEIMRGSEHARGGSLEAVERVLIDVTAALPLDQQAAELLDLVRKARGLPRAP